MAPPPDCWLHPSVAVRPSSIAGRGLFATVDVASGTAISRLGGRLVGTAELHALLAASSSYVDTIAYAADTHLVLPPGRPNGCGNHACDPNLWWSDALTLVARRDITAGEELTNDYATSTADPGFALPCACGSPLCRGTVTGDDWRRGDLQARYGEHWVPAVLSLIRARATG